MESACQAAGGWGSGELEFHGCRISVWEDEKVLEKDGGNGCTARICLMPFNGT